MAKLIKNIPSPDILMNSMRSIGYNFQTALADIIDNSISAKCKNIYICSPIDNITNKDLYITILDDGIGMNRDSLFNAMKYGSDRDNYSSEDLGRFGLGLKSASLSQCKVLTVASKINNIISAFQWNLDTVIKNKTWDCIELEQEEIENIPNIKELKKLSQGTLVVWQDFDIAYKKSNGRVYEFISEEIEKAEYHIRLTFHRFLSKRNKPLKIYINNYPLVPFDPFLEDTCKTDSRPISEIRVNNSIIKVQSFILPHQTDLDDNDIEKLGGIESLKNGQGFYIYRNERLIIHGTWFRLSASNINSELYKYGRIKVDIPNSLDDLWEIDIKKQNAVIPKQILQNLKNEVTRVTNGSKGKTSKRTKLTLDKDDTKIWNKKLSRDNKDQFYINTESKFILNYLDDFDDKDKAKIIRLLDIISSSIPYNDLYNSICNNQNETKHDDDMIDSIIILGIDWYKRIKEIIKCSKKEAYDKVCSNEPFNTEVISKKLWERIKDEK